MVPSLVPTPAAGADNGIRVEAATLAALAGATTLRRWKDKGTFSPWELCLAARRGLSRQVDKGLRVAMEHQESPWGGRRSVGVGLVMSGPWTEKTDGGGY